MNALTKSSDHSVTDYTGQQLDLIKRTVAKDCNASEFDLFMMVARRARLDPFRKQIMALVFSKDNADKRQMAIVTGIDGLRAIAARSGRYRPDEEEPSYTYDEALKSPANPLGIFKVNMRIWVADAAREGGWRPVAGVAYWDEYAPIKEESSEGYRWVDTGETWPDTGKPKKKRVPNEGGEIIPTLDPKTQWPKMPRVMIAKCAEAGAIRKAFPEDTSGLYEYAEFDRAQAELLPSEVIGELETEGRLLRIGASNGIVLQLFPNAPLEVIPLGQVADRVLETIEGFSTFAQIHWFEGANTQPLREFWARAPGDALELKKKMEAARARLEAATRAEADTRAS